MRIKIILTVVVCYFELLLIAVRSKVMSYIDTHYAWWRKLMDAIEVRWWLLGVTIVLFYSIIVYYSWLESERKKGSPYRISLFVTTGILILFYSNLPQPEIMGHSLHFMLVAGIWLLLCGAKEGYMLWRTYRNNNGISGSNDSESVENGATGFANITQTDDLKDIGWANYAKNLYDKLLVTNVEEAYAVGINAQWGYGKTTFLGHIKDCVTEKEILIEFNPWLSSSTDQIIKDFFENLKDKLRKEDELLDSYIDDYVNLLVEMEVNDYLTAAAKMWKGTVSKSIEKSRNNIQDRIDKIGKRVIVIVDDLDRLEKEEIYEVMKLIRNTAKFKSLIYVAAYDRNYICETLKQKGIVNPDTYLHKIFQMELLLPAFEGDMIDKMLIEELNKQLTGEGKLEYLSEIKSEIMLTARGDMALNHFLHNFRDVKRFANTISLEIEQIAFSNIKYDILARCLFWIEIIHYAFEDTYLQLRNDYSVLLEKRKFDDCLMIKDEEATKEKIDRHLYAVLHFLFSGYQNPRSIQNVNSYSTYFSLRPYVNQIGWTEYINTLNNCSQEQAEAKMKEWLDSEDDKRYSLYTRYKGMKIGRTRPNSAFLKNYILTLQTWVDYKNDKYCLDYVPELCAIMVNQKNNSREDTKEELIRQFDAMIRHLLEKRENCAIVVKIIAEIYPLEMDGETMNPVIIPFNQMKEYLKMAFDKFVEGFDVGVEEIVNSQSDLHRMMNCSKIVETDGMIEENSTILCKYVLDYFKAKKDSNPVQVITDKFKPDDEMVNSGYADVYIEREVVNDIERYFVDVPFFKDFMRECFNWSEDECNFYFRTIGIG